jgi:hypothetical protein
VQRRSMHVKTLLWVLLLAVSCVAQASAQILYDEFNGLSLDPARWSVSGGGTVSVADGALALSASCGLFPYVTTVNNPFPATGDFYVRVGFRYTSPQAGGNGFGVTNGWAIGGPGRGCWVWQDYCCGGLRAVCGDLLVTIANAPESGYHVYEWRCVNSVYQFFFDGVLLATNSSSFRPTGFFIGSPAINYCPWTSQQTNFVEIGPFLPTATRPTSWGRLKTVYR